MKKLLPFVVLTLVLVGCGGSGSSDSSGASDNNGASENNDASENEVNAPVEGQCVISQDTITVENNSSCTLSDADADAYNINSGGEVTCNDGTMVFGFLSAGSGTINFNGLTLTCGS